METFSVTWRIDVEADTPQQAAEAALEIMLNPTFPDTFFEVTNEDQMVGDCDEDSLCICVPYPAEMVGR